MIDKAEHKDESRRPTRIERFVVLLRPDVMPEPPIGGALA